MYAEAYIQILHMPDEDLDESPNMTDTNGAPSAFDEDGELEE